MGRKPRYSKEIKLLAIKQYREGIKSSSEISNELDLNRNSLYSWVRNHESMGESVFDPKLRNNTYTKELKLEIIKTYVNGEDSYNDLARKYQIPSKGVIINWVSKYNRDIKIEDYNPKGYVYMIKSRKVNYEEKLEIIKWTIKSGLEYKLAAEKFETSYAQIYNWVKKYNELGEDGLVDNRGKRKQESALTEVDKLKREVELLRKKNERLELEQEVTKKYLEIERRDLLVKSARKLSIKQ